MGGRLSHHLHEDINDVLKLGDPWPMERIQNEAACRDHDRPEIFFPTTEEERRAYGPQALALCLGCTVRIPCLEMATRSRAGNTRFGIWGGRDERERASINNHRRLLWKS